jgi:hypothetical protein
MDDNSETLISNLPDTLDVYYNRGKVEPQGSFKALKDRVLKITNYTEKDGAGRPLKRNRWS